jgi:hypothetical protein
VSFEKDLFEKRKILRKDWGNTSVTGGLRTGDSKKFESIRINLRDFLVPGLSQGSRVFETLDP